MRYSAPRLACWLYEVARCESERKIDGAMPAAGDVKAPPPADWKRFVATVPFATCSYPFTPSSNGPIQIRQSLPIEENPVARAQHPPGSGSKGQTDAGTEVVGVLGPC